MWCCLDHGPFRLPAFLVVTLSCFLVVLWWSSSVFFFFPRGISPPAAWVEKLLSIYLLLRSRDILLCFSICVFCRFLVILDITWIERRCVISTLLKLYFHLYFTSSTTPYPLHVEIWSLWRHNLHTGNKHTHTMQINTVRSLGRAVNCNEHTDKNTMQASTHETNYDTCVTKMNRKDTTKKGPIITKEGKTKQHDNTITR